VTPVTPVTPPTPLTVAAKGADAGARSRETALSILVRVETASSHAAPLLEARSRSLPQRDRDFVRALVKSVLRNRALLDHVLSRHLSRSLSSLDPPVRAALRTGAAQILRMGGVPARAAVAATVEAVKAHSPRGAGLVNAVLRRVAEGEAPPGEIRLPAGIDEVARLALSTSHPEWIVRRWISFLGEARARGALEADQKDGMVDLLADPLAGTPDEIAEVLRESGCKTSPSAWAPLALTVTSGNAVASPLVSSGRVAVIDAAAQALAALVLPGRVVADLGAAPGGKTRTLLARGIARRVVAVERHPSRIARLARNLEAAGRRGEALLVLGDASRPPLARGALRSILLDAPCSGTGTLRKNPEIRWRLAPGDLAGFAASQRTLLAAALELLAPGGRLVYVTCSLEPEENEEVVSAVLGARGAEGGIHVVPLGPESFPPGEVALFRAGGVVLPPGETNDGFTAFVLERSA